jgi:hypothetical protein
MTTEERLRTITENEHKVYEAGARDMMAAIQQYGARQSYNRGFAQWNSAAFYPVYDIKPTGDSGQIFYNMKNPFDLTERLKECGVVFDTGGCTAFGYAFMSSDIIRVPEIDARNMDNVNYMFTSAPSLVTIDLLVLKDDGSQSFIDAFSWSPNIQNIAIEGIIGQKISFSSATKMTRESIESVIYALSPDTAGLTVTLSKTAVNKAFATSGEANDGTTSAEWLALIGTRSNWTISLV